MKENNIMSLVQLQHIETTCYMHQYLNNQLPIALMCKFDEIISKREETRTRSRSSIGQNSIPKILPYKNNQAII